MSSIRIVYAEMEGSDESIQQVLSQFVARSSGQSALRELAPPQAVPVAVITAPAAEVDVPANVPRRKYKRRVGGQAKGRRKAAPSVLESGPAGRSPLSAAREQSADGVQGEIREQLAKGPMTSGDLCRALKHRSNGSVYTALSTMRNNRDVETKVDENDGQRKNYLAG